MARIRNTSRDQKRTRSLYDEETMGSVYDPPGISFDEQGGEVAQIRQEVVDDVVAKFPHLERVDDTSESSADSAPSDSLDSEESDENDSAESTDDADTE